MITYLGGIKLLISLHFKIFYRGLLYGLVKIKLMSPVPVLLQQDCPNGRLTPAKFVDMYKMFFLSGNAVEFCDHVFRTFDMDKNGYIDFKVTLLW